MSRLIDNYFGLVVIDFLLLPFLILFDQFEGMAAGFIHIASQMWPSGSARLRLYMKP